MFNYEQKDKQVEFFKDISDKSKGSGKNRLRLAKIALSLSYENMIILSIGLIMLLIVCYSLGVERGRQLAQVKGEDMNIEQEQAESSPQEVAPKPKEKRMQIKVAQVTEVFKASPYIQVASFRTDKYAIKEMEGLKSKGYQPYLARWGRYTVVCVGGYKDKDEAHQALVDLKKLYADCILRDK